MTHFGSAITDSPIIDSQFVFGASAGLTWRWR